MLTRPRKSLLIIDQPRRKKAKTARIIFAWLFIDYTQATPNDAQGWNLFHLLIFPFK